MSELPGISNFEQNIASIQNSTSGLYIKNEIVLDIILP